MVWFAWAAILGSCGAALRADVGVSVSHALTAARQAHARPVGSVERAASTRLSAQWALVAAVEFFESEERSPEAWELVEQALATASSATAPACSVEGVPYVRQSDESLCAIACALMALRYLRVAATEEQLLELAEPSAPDIGVHVSYLDRFVSHYDAQAIVGEGTVDLLRCALAAGYPVLVYQYAWTDNDVRHMRAIVGFDDTRSLYFAMDPSADMGPLLAIPYADFDLLWSLPWRDDGLGHWLCIIYSAPAEE